MKIYKIYRSNGRSVATTRSVIDAVLACQVDAKAEVPATVTFKKVLDALYSAGACILTINKSCYLIEQHFAISECEDDELYYCQSINMEGVNYDD